MIPAGVHIVDTSVWLPRDPAYSGALYTRADDADPGGAALTDGAAGAGSVRELRHSACPGARPTRG